MKYLYPLLLLLFILAGCSSEDDNAPGDDSADNFDRQAMLANWADNIIVPALTAFAEQTAQLKQSASQFVNQPSQTYYDELTNIWLEAYTSWQRISMFEIGKAEEVRFRNNMNIYPVDAEEIEENILNGDYNLELPSLVDAQGFPALDYLLFGVRETKAEVIALYQNDGPDGNYATYLMNVVNRMDVLTNQVLSAWENGYRDDFVNNSGNSANASVDRLVNDYIFYYEKNLRAGKIGIPAGVFSGSTLSTHVEAVYKEDISKVLLVEALSAAQDFFNGQYFSGTAEGPGLKQYLDYLGTEKNGQPLSEMINNQFEASLTATNQLLDNFSEQVQTDNTPMLATFDQLQLNVVLLKVDMLQALNINVDFVDADGD